MIDGNQLREEFGRYLAEHKATRWGMDAALMHVCKIAYDAGKADGPGAVLREEATGMTDYMKEAERLIEEYGNAEWKVGKMSEHSDDAEEIVTRENARAALLAHIQRGAPAPAGVPMPKPVAYGFGNTAITGHTNRLMMVRLDIPGGDQYAGAFWLPLVLADEAHTYGAACRAAGEAAGYARGLKPRVPLDAINKMLSDCMDVAVQNGANSVSMPDHYVEVAAWVCGIKDAAKMMAEPAEVPSADQLWNNDEVMALNAELGLTLDQMSRLVRAALRGEVKP